MNCVGGVGAEREGMKDGLKCQRLLTIKLVWAAMTQILGIIAFVEWRLSGVREYPGRIEFI